MNFTVVIIFIITYLSIAFSDSDSLYDGFDVVSYNDTENPWMSLYSVNDLKNREVAVFVISTCNNRGYYYIIIKNEYLQISHPNINYNIVI